MPFDHQQIDDFRAGMEIQRERERKRALVLIVTVFYNCDWMLTNTLSYDPFSGVKNANNALKWGSAIWVCAVAHWDLQIAVFSKLNPDKAIAAIRKLLDSVVLSAPLLNISMASRIFNWKTAINAARVYSCLAHSPSINRTKLSFVVRSNVHPLKCRQKSRWSLLFQSIKNYSKQDVSVKFKSLSIEWINCSYLYPFMGNPLGKSCHDNKTVSLIPIMSFKPRPQSSWCMCANICHTDFNAALLAKSPFFCISV